jgi:DNA-binding transcriptional regulator YiaG
MSKESLALELDYSLFMMNGVMDSNRIKRIRKTYGMRQVEFADLLGVIYTTYISWEKGVRNPSSPSCALLQIAEKHPAIFLQNRKEIVQNVMKYFGKKS